MQNVDSTSISKLTAQITQTVVSQSKTNNTLEFAEVKEEAIAAEFKKISPWSLKTCWQKKRP